MKFDMTAQAYVNLWNELEWINGQEIEHTVVDIHLQTQYKLRELGLLSYEVADSKKLTEFLLKYS